jgi:hypothetical protein
MSIKRIIQGLLVTVAVLVGIPVSLLGTIIIVGLAGDKFDQFRDSVFYSKRLVLQQMREASGLKRKKSTAAERVILETASIVGSRSNVITLLREEGFSCKQEEAESKRDALLCLINTPSGVLWWVYLTANDQDQLTKARVQWLRVDDTDFYFKRPILLHMLGAVIPYSDSPGAQGGDAGEALLEVAPLGSDRSAVMALLVAEGFRCLRKQDIKPRAFYCDVRMPSGGMWIVYLFGNEQEQLTKVIADVYGPPSL